MSKDVMSKIRAGDVWRELDRVLREYRVDTFEVLDQRPHPVLVIRHLGLERSMSFSGSPSSRFTCKNEAAMLRRILKQMQMEAITGTGKAPVEDPDESTEIGLHTFGPEPTVLDTDLGKRLGMARPTNIRQVITANFDEIQSFGPLHVENALVEIGSGAKRNVGAYYLTEEQALLVCAMSKAPKAAEVRRMLIRVFVAWRHGVPVDGPLADIPHAILTREDMNTIGGIVKAVTGKQVADLRAELVEMMVGVAQRTAIAAPAYDLSTTVTSREMMDMAGVDRAGRVRGTTGIITRRMKDFCLARGFAADRTPSHIDPDTRWRFPRTAAHEWLFGSTLGAEVIRSHIVKSHRGHGFTVVQPSLALGGAGARA